MLSRRRLMMASQSVIKGSVNGIIQDDWKTIGKICAKGPEYVKKYYKIGDVKPVPIEGEGTIDYEIIGIGVQDKADGTGKAPTTWIGLDLLKTKVEWGSQAYVNSTLRNHYHNVIKSLVPELIRNNLIKVKKICHNAPAYTSDSNTLNEEVWAPSLDEVCLSVSSQTDYANHWNGSAHNKKCCYGTNVSSSWWLRDSYSNKEAESVQSNGTYKSVSNSNELDVPLCFCL